MTKIIIFTGKGGVGKSSISTAHALEFANENRKTLLISTDMAHNLGDIFKISIGHKIRNVKENLDVIELNPNTLRNEMFPKIKESVVELSHGYNIEFTNLNENFVLPGFGNLFCLLKIKEFYDSNEYDYIVVDCAPTGETLALLKIPELLAWYMEKFFPVGKTIVRILAPISKLKYGVELPSYKTMNTVEKIHKKLIDLQYTLKNRDICSIKIVCIPEKMIVEESKRNYMYLNLYQFNVDEIFINRVLENIGENKFLNHWRQVQQKYIKELEEVFTHIPMIKIPWYPNEIQGIQSLEKIASRIKTLKNNSCKPCNFISEKYRISSNGYILDVYLPEAKIEDIKVFIHEMDLNIKIKNFNRCIPLPNVLRGSTINKICLENEILSIEFKIKKEKEEEI